MEGKITGKVFLMFELYLKKIGKGDLDPREEEYQCRRIVYYLGVMFLALRFEKLIVNKGYEFLLGFLTNWVKIFKEGSFDLSSLGIKESELEVTYSIIGLFYSIKVNSDEYYSLLFTSFKDITLYLFLPFKKDKVLGTTYLTAVIEECEYIAGLYLKKLQSLRKSL